MADLTLRVAAAAAPAGSTYTTKSAPLLYAEADNNFINLDTEIHNLDLRLTNVEANVTQLLAESTEVAAVAPATPQLGQFWYDTANDETYIWDGTTWQIVGGAGGSTSTVSLIAPAGPAIGDLWYDLNTSSLNVWDGAAWQDASGVTIIDGLDDVISTGVTPYQILAWDPTATDGTNVGQWVATHNLDASPDGGATDDF